jgi:hypothetical protein
VCDGTSATCPADTLSSAGTVCRGSAGICDPQEVCTGSSPACPTDARSPSGTVCRATTGPCDPQEVCDGSAATCPTDARSPAGTVCRASTGGCDPAEVCDGSAASCPADAIHPSGFVCRASTGTCDPQETCNGISTACPSDVLLPAGTVCRASTDQCDPQEVCTGTAGACPADAFLPNGTACTDGDACTFDECQSGVCVSTDTTPAGQCCDPSDGSLTPIDDGNACTFDTCNPDGTVTHTAGGSVGVNLKVEALANAVTRNVTFVLTTCGGATDTRVIPVVFNAFGNANVTLNNVDAAAGWLAIQEGHTLRRRSALSFSACTASVDLSGSRLLLAGDFQTTTVPQDNLVDITDFSILASRWNVPIDRNLSTGADANGDGLQGSADFTAIQVNFFRLGEGIHACTAEAGQDTEVTDGGDITPVRIDSTRVAPRSSLWVSSAPIPNAYRADLNNDGRIDTRDMRVFAEVNGLELLPEFLEVAEKLESKTQRGGHLRDGGR